MAPERAASLAFAELSHQLRLDLRALEDEAAEIARGRSSTGGNPDAVWMAFLAVHLDRFYTAAEAAFERIARTLGEPMPTGQQWHRILLHQATIPIQDVRPAVLSGSAEAQLEPLFKFRHWLRHAYRAPFDWALMRAVVESVPDALLALRRDLTAFLAWLDTAAQNGTDHA